MFSVYDKSDLQLGKIYTLFWSGENIGAWSYGDGPISRLWYNVWLPLDFCVLHLHIIVNPTKSEIKLDATWSYVKRQRQKWNFCLRSFPLWTVEWKYLYLWRIVGDIFLFLCDFNEGLEEKNTNSEVIFAVCRLPFAVCRLPFAVWGKTT